MCIYVFLVNICLCNHNEIKNTCTHIYISIKFGQYRIHINIKCVFILIYFHRFHDINLLNYIH